MAAVQHCDRCGATWTYQWKCQIICPNCGARQDCSDLFVDYDAIRQAHVVQNSAEVTPDADSAS